MITAPRILSVMEERCRCIGARLHGEELDGYELTDIETSLLLIDGTLTRWLHGSLDRHSDSEALCAARAVHKRMHDRLRLIGRYRDELLVAERRGFLCEVQGHALEALLALQGPLDRESASLHSDGGAIRALTSPGARYTASELRMGIGRTRK